MKYRVFIISIALFLNLGTLRAFERGSAQYEYLSAYIQSPQLRHDLGDLFRLYLNNLQYLYNETNEVKSGDALSLRGELDELTGIINYLTNIHPDQIALLDTSWDRIAFFVNLFNALSITIQLEESWNSLHQSIKNDKISLEAKFRRFYDFDRYFLLNRFYFPHIGLLSLNDIMFGIIMGKEDYLKEVEGYAPEEFQRIRTMHEMILSDHSKPYIDFRITFMLNQSCGLGPSIHDLPFKRAVRGTDLKDEDLLESITDSFLKDREMGIIIKYHKINDWFSSRYERIVFELPYFLSFFKDEIDLRYGNHVDFVLKYVKRIPTNGFFFDWFKENPEVRQDISIDYRLDKDLLKLRTKSIYQR